MAIWPFNRKQEESTLPEEVQEYYASTSRQRVGIAWLLALATLVVTVLLTLGIFYGGKWVFNHFRGNGEQATPVEVTQSPQNQAPQENQPANNQDADQNAGTQTTPQTSQAPAQLPADQNEPTAAPSPSITQPVTGKDVPNTGPGDVVAIFVVASVAGTLLHNRLLAKRD